MTRDVAATLRMVSELHRLGARLPHIPTPSETARLSRFAELAASPAAATDADADTLATGWRSWWRAGRAHEIVAMATQIAPGVVEGDRRLATYAVAAAGRIRERGAQ